MKLLSYSVLAAIGLMLASAGAQAQGSNKTDATTLAEWEASEIYDLGGLRADYILGEEVFGPNGEEIGNVENVIIGSGHIVAIIAEVGGFWDIADTHIAVPWKEVQLTPDGFKIPVTEENYEDYALFAENSFVTMKSLGQAQQVDDTLATGAETWKLSALTDDYVVLEDGAGYGYVDDVIFSKDGKIKAVLVVPTVAAYGHGVYAVPFYSHGWQPYDSVYTLPFGPDEVTMLDQFDYSRFNSYWY